MIGDGRFRSQLEQQAVRSGVGGAVDFRGQMAAGQAVRDQLDLADLFVLPSRTEGLPRAMIEAMARGLPCIGSNVGGIPELLPPEDLFPSGDPQALAAKISEVLTDGPRRQRMSQRNLARARDFHEDVLRARRLRFYRFIRTRTEDWLRRKVAA
jgi:glycosyltransferase involved in cell wall biosynthesis